MTDTSIKGQDVNAPGGIASGALYSNRINPCGAVIATGVPSAGETTVIPRAGEGGEITVGPLVYTRCNAIIFDAIRILECLGTCRCRAQIKNPPRHRRHPGGRGAHHRGRPFPPAATGCPHGLHVLQDRDRLPPRHEPPVAVPEDDLGVFPPVPVEVLRCLPRRYLART